MLVSFSFRGSLCARGAYCLPGADECAEDECHGHSTRRCKGQLVPQDHFPQGVEKARWRRVHRFVFEVPANVDPHLVGSRVALFAIFLQAAHDYLIEIAPYELCQARGLHLSLRGDGRQPLLALTQASAGLGRLLLADAAEHFIERGLAQGLAR